MTYKDNSIRSLSDRQAAREKAPSLLGSDDVRGAFQTILEIVANSIDEHKSGYGNVIEVTYDDQYLTVKDYGRGVPMGWNESEQKYNYELIFQKLYAGGKYENNTENANYEFSLGTNGLGASLTCFTSEYMSVTSYRNKTEYKATFTKGEYNDGSYTEVKSDNLSGTIIRWKPDLDVFSSIDIPVEWIEQLLKEQAVVNKGLKFVLQQNDKDKKEYFYENGIQQYVDELSNEKVTNIQYFEAEGKGKDADDRKEYRVKIELSFVFDNHSPFIQYFHNSSKLEYGGSPADAIKLGFTNAIDNLIKQKGSYQKGEKKITFDDVKDSLVIVSNTYSTLTSYENQTKKAINNKFVKDFMVSKIKEWLEIYFIENPLEADKIINQVLINKRSREKAESTRLDVKKKLSGTVNNITSPVANFVNCKSKNRDEKELFFVEGKSALGSVKMGRDQNTQAIYPLRGKILNLLKAELSKVLSNPIVQDIVKIIGCGIEIETKKKDFSTFDYNNLQFNKIIILTDGDVDGYHIRCLLLTALYRLVPTLIRNGHVYICLTPLYEFRVKEGKGEKSYYAYDEHEKVQLLEELQGKKYEILRSKGLGENTAEMMWETTMNPQTRRLIQVTVDEMDKLTEIFELFLGENLSERKEYIATHLHEYSDQY